MARPRSNKPTRKGGGTSFGKQSGAEKSFYKKKKGRFEDTSDSRDRERGSGPASRGFRKTNERFDKGPAGKRFSSSKPGGRPFTSKGPGTGSRFDNKEDKPFDKRSFRSKPGGSSRFDGPPRFDKKRPFQSKNEGGSSRSDGPPRFDKKRPFQSKSEGSSPRFDGPPRFDKKRSFPSKGEGSAPRFEGPSRFDKRPFRSKNEGGPAGFEKKPFRSKSEGYDQKKTFKERGDSERPRRSAPGGFSKPRTEGESPRKKPFNPDERKSFVQSRVVRSGDFTKPIKDKSGKGEETTKTSHEAPKQEGLTRLNKYIANAGVGSRRQADELIKMGLISVNGVTITELGSKVKAGDVVRYEDRVLKAERLVYVLLNKPKGFITTTEDPQERNTVMGLIAGACKERIYPVGRLDRNTTGLLLLTNDGDLADKLTHPSYKAKKVYKVELDKPLTKNDLVAIREGVRLEEGRAQVDDVAVLSDDNKAVGLEIHIGWNRVVRRIFESLGYEVIKLDRSVFAGLDKKDIGRGQWRFLKSEEVIRLKHFK